MKKVEVIKGGNLLSNRNKGKEITLIRVAAYCRVSTGDEEQISFTDLSNSMQTNLAAKLAEYGLTFDDVEVWRDHDSFSDDHYQIRLKQSESNTSQEPIGFGDL